MVAKYAAPHAEPLSFLVLRYLGVIVLMTALAVVARAAWPRGAQIGHLAVAGIGIQAGYLGGVWVAVSLGLPAGLAALVANLQPLLTAAIAAGLLGERLGRPALAGLVLGFLGVLLVVSDQLTVEGVTWASLALIVTALFAITLGTLYQQRFCGHFDLRTGQVVQFVASLLVTLPLVATFESFAVTWNAQVVGALAWSVLVLTGGGISLLFLMLRRGAASQVTSYFYLVPGITALMAWLMFGESLGLVALAGMAVAVAGVALATRWRRPVADG